MTWVRLAEASDAAQYGNKAVRLGAALRAGLPVPDGLALSVDFVSSVAQAAEGRLAELERLLTLGGGFIAVRSSASAEDSARASFAGQYPTELNVTTALGLGTALQRLALSAHSESAALYRQHMGITSPPKVAAIVQGMIDAEVAGVLFTRDPLSGAATCLIEASWGLGEAVVGSRVTPDSFRLDAQGKVGERRAGAKEAELQLRPGGGLQEVTVSGSRVRSLCLNDTQLQQLFALASRCTRLFGAGLDLEWAYTKGEVFLLQCRPITA